MYLPTADNENNNSHAAGVFRNKLEYQRKNYANQYCVFPPHVITD